MMKTRSLEKWIWILIYGGLLILGLGLSIGLRDEAVGSAIVWAGAVAAALGVLGIFVRSRLTTKD